MNLEQERKNFTEMDCICCDNKITLLNMSSSKKKLIDMESEDYDPTSQMWGDGVVDKMCAGYGSIFDGDIIYFGMCDSCIELKYKEGKIYYGGDYIFNSSTGHPTDHDMIRRGKLRDSKIDKLLDDEDEDEK